MKPPLLLNENFPSPGIPVLRASGLDVLAVAEDMPGANDPQVLTVARETRRWLVTFDRDYGELVFRLGYLPPPAILYMRQDPVPVQRLAQRLIELLENPDEFEGFLSVISEQKVRRRALPLRAA